MGPRAEQIIRVTKTEPARVEERLRVDPMVKSDGISETTSDDDDDDDRSSLSTRSRGTGGTDIMPFLKQSRDETLAAKVNM